MQNEQQTPGKLGSDKELTDAQKHRLHTRSRCIELNNIHENYCQAFEFLFQTHACRILGIYFQSLFPREY